jgi:hypothetical protein
MPMGRDPTASDATPKVIQLLCAQWRCIAAFVTVKTTSKVGALNGEVKNQLQ